MPRKLLKTLLKAEVAHFKVRKTKPNSRQTIGLFEIGPLFNKKTPQKRAFRSSASDHKKSPQ